MANLESPGTLGAFFFSPNENPAPVAAPMLEIAIALIVGFAAGYAVRE
jgi:hypothetical protein